MNNIRLIICDDLEEIRNYFSVIIGSEPGMEVVGIASSGESVIQVVKDTMPDMVLIDLQMETEDSGIHATKYIKDCWPDMKVIIITVHDDDEFIFRSYEAGADDYILKTSSAIEILGTIKSVYNNENSIKPFAAKKLMSEFKKMRKQRASLMYTASIVSNLTNSEVEILKCLYNGMTRTELAQKRCVELVTINTQIGNILKKFKYRSTKELLTDLNHLKFFDLLRDFKSQVQNYNS